MIEQIENLKKELDIPNNLQELGINKDEYFSKIDLLAEHAFDDQCTPANPRYPLISEIKEIYEKLY